MLSAALVLGGLVLRRSSKETQRLQAISERLQEQILIASNRLDKAQVRADSQRKNLDRQMIESDSTVSELADLGRRRSRSSASEESADAHPPAELPAWDPDSPHIWVDKRLFQGLHLYVFLPDGSLTPVATEILALDKPKANQLSEILRRIVSDHRHQETTRARVEQEHLPDIAKYEGQKFTLRVDPPPENSANFKAEFETALTENLGDSTLPAHRWINQQWVVRNLRCPAEQGQDHVVRTSPRWAVPHGRGRWPDTLGDRPPRHQVICPEAPALFHPG